MEEVERSAKLRLATRQLMGVRANIKRLQVKEKALKAEMGELWGEITLRSETRVLDSRLTLTARRQTRSSYPYDIFSADLGDYVWDMGIEEALEMVTERKISKKQVDALIKAGKLSGEVRKLLEVTSRYVVWVVEEDVK